MPASSTRMAAMIATIDGRPSATQRAYTRAATRTAMRMPIMGPAFPAAAAVNPDCRLAARRQQCVPVEHRARHLHDAPVRGPRLVAQALERLAVADAVA